MTLDKIVNLKISGKLYNYYKNITVEKGPIIKYNFDNNNKYYHSDFYLLKYNLICEIKSSYYYDKFISINKEKEKQSIKDGYNFIFIINKNYIQLNNYIN